MRWALPATLVVLLAGIPPTTADKAALCPTEDKGFQRLKTDEVEIAVRWEPAELRVGQFFTAEVIACPGSGQVEEIAIDADMPAHGHGMNYRPVTTRVYAGHYRFTGLMLHMPGTWRFTFVLIQGGKRTRITQEVSLKR